MENISEFNLNLALQHWLARLGESPQVKAENLKELESHVRDSVVQLQTKGLSSEESFLVATHRVGSPEKLEPEFAKVNGNPMNKIIHGVILIFFGMGCWFLSGMLYLSRTAAESAGHELPAFTRLLFAIRPLLAVPPLLALVYCVFVWLRKPGPRSSWVGFFAITAGLLMLLTLPVVVAVLLPVFEGLNRLAGK